MVDRPDINPQVFQKRRNTVTPTLEAATPNFRSAPSVTNFAADSVADTLVSMTDDSRRLELVSADSFDLAQENFDRVLREIRDDQEVESEAKLARAKLSYQARVAEIRETGDPNSLPEDSTEAFEEVMTDLLEDDDLSLYQKNYLNPRVEEGRIRMAEGVLEYQARLREIEQENNLAEIMRAASVTSFNNPAAFRDEIEAIRQSGPMQRLNDVEREKAMQKIEQDLAASSIRGYVQSNAGTALSLLKQGAYDDILDGNLKAQYVDMAEANIKKVKQGKTFEQLRAKAMAKANMKRDPYSYTDADIERLWQQDIITDGEVPQMIMAREDAKLELDAENLTIARVYEAANGRSTLSPIRKEDVDAVDLTYERTVMPEVEKLRAEGNHAAANTTMANWVSDVGVMPTMVKEDLVSAIRSEDPNAILQAGSVLDRIEEQRPKMVTVPPADRAKLDRLNEVLRFETDPVQAVRTVAQEDRNEFAEVRTKNFNSEYDPSEAQRAFEKAMDDWWFGAPELSLEGESVARLQADMKAAAKAYYLTKPQADDDMYKAAVNTIKENWAVSRADGNGRYMKYAPELYLPEFPEIGHTYIQADLHETVTSVNPNLQAGDYLIVPDDITTGRISQNKLPSYRIMVSDERGVNQLMDADGKLLRYEPPQLTREEAMQKLPTVRELKEQSLNSGGEMSVLLNNLMAVR